MTDIRALDHAEPQAAQFNKKSQPEGEENARTRILRAASELFCRYGINATGVDAITESAGAAKATLYKLFGSKERLVEAVLDDEGRKWREWFLAEIDSLEAEPFKKLTGLFGVLEDWFGQERFFGCPFINAVAEFDKKDQKLRDIALRHKSIVIARIQSLAHESGTADPDLLAHGIGLLIDGSIVAAMVTGDPAIARHARRAAEAMCR